MTQPCAAAEAVLRTAADIAGLDVTDAQIIRDVFHAMYRLTSGVVGRVGRPGTADAASREIAVSDWLAGAGTVVTRPIDGLVQPVVVDTRPMTYWRLLPEHRAATPARSWG